MLVGSWDKTVFLRGVMRSVIRGSVDLTVAAVMRRTLVRCSGFVGFAIVGGVLFFLFTFLTFRCAITRSVFREGDVNGGICMSAGADRGGTRSVQGFSFTRRDLCTPPMVLRKSIFLSRVYGGCGSRNMGN